MRNIDVDKLLKVKIFDHLLKQRKITNVNGIDEDINNVIDVTSIISSLNKGEVRVFDQHGIAHNIEEYEVCPQFERLCTGRGVYFDDSDFVHNLKADSVDRRYGELRKKSKVQSKSTDSSEDAIETSAYLDALYLKVRTVPLTPAEFRSAQIRIVNAMKGNIDHWTAISELTKPILLSSVKVLTDGESVSQPTGDWAELPYNVTIVKEIYTTYKFSYPLSQYIDTFAMYFVANLG